MSPGQQRSKSPLQPSPCVLCSASDACTKAQVGYQLPPALVNLAESTGVLSHTAENAIEATTKALILHPIACGVSFFAFLIAALSDRLGFICAAFIAFVAMLCAAVAMVLDIVLFYVLRAYLDKYNINSLVSVSYSVGTWTCVRSRIRPAHSSLILSLFDRVRHSTVAAFCCLFIGMFFTLCACITDRRRRRRGEKW